MSENKLLTLNDRWNMMTEVEQDTVQQLHRLLREIKAKSPEEIQRMKLYIDPVQFMEDIEHTLQGLWKFTRDRDFHTHWIDLPGCTCPKLDNQDLMGAPYRIVNASCPHHNQEQPF